MKISIDRLDLLDLINCSFDYGFNNNVLLTSFADWLEYLNDSEIELYARELLKDSMYDEEDYNKARERLLKFKKVYLSKQ